jgi:hypothetical protein
LGSNYRLSAYKDLVFNSAIEPAQTDNAVDATPVKNIVVKTSVMQ